jgi:hypothetical protein
VAKEGALTTGTMKVNGVILLPDGGQATFRDGGDITGRCVVDDIGITVRGWYGSNVKIQKPLRMGNMFPEDGVDPVDELKGVVSNTDLRILRVAMVGRLKTAQSRLRI